MTVTRVPARAGGIDLAEVEAWEAGLDAMIEQIGRQIRNFDTRGRIGEYIRGLLSDVERKNGWQLAELAGHANPWQFQYLLNRSSWDANVVRDGLRGYVVDHLGTPVAIGVLDETGFLKKGDQSVGVQRQYSGTAGKVENCQLGVFLGYVSEHGRAFLDRELYLPKSWTRDPARCQAAGVPRHVTFATKAQLGKRMLQRALDARVPMAWVTGDEVYGNDPKLRRWLESRAMGYVLAIASNQPVVEKRTAAQVAAELPADVWQQLSAGEGSKGPRLYDWAWVPLGKAALRGWARWLLVRRSLADPAEVAYYRVFAKQDTTLAEVVRVAGARWGIEELIEAAKGEVGLDQYEVRKWPGWYRHVTLALLAHAFLAVTRRYALARTAEKKGPNRMAAFKRSRQ